MIEILHIASQILELCFFIFIGYGAFLIVQDKDREWKARYGNRWILSRSEREELDAKYEAAQRKNKKAARAVKYRSLSRYANKRAE